MSEVPFHPAANLFPLLNVESREFSELVTDLREQGLLDPIELFEGQILDGRNRYRACQHAGVESRFVNWFGDSPVRHVISKNLYRRHLTDGQRAAIALELLPMLEEEATKRMVEGGRKGGQALGESTQGLTTADLWTADQERQQVRRSRKAAAEAMQVTEHKVRQAKTIAKADPELIQEVKAGTTTLVEAERKVKKSRRPELNPDVVVPGQVIKPPRVRQDPTLNDRLIRSVDNVSRTGALRRLAQEIQEMDLDLPTETIRELQRRLSEERGAREALRKALQVVLDRRNHTT